MDKILSVEFTFRSKAYYALVRSKMNKEEKQYYITIMNGNLERLLYGHHIITESEGVLSSSTFIDDEEILELKQCIIDALIPIILESAIHQHVEMN